MTSCLLFQDNAALAKWGLSKRKEFVSGPKTKREAKYNNIMFSSPSSVPTDLKNTVKLHC